MKRTKLWAMVLSFVLLCTLLSGCMSNVIEVQIQPDGSGSCQIYAGLAEEAYLQLMEFVTEEGAEPDDADFKEFTYNGKKYYGQQLSFDFQSIEELDETLEKYTDDVGSTEDNIEIGSMDFEVAENGTLTFSLLTSETTGSTAAIEEEVYHMEADAESQKELEELLQSMVAVLDMSFPAPVQKTAGADTDAIVIEDNRLHVDYLKLAEDLQGQPETFTFTTSIHPSKTSETSQIVFSDVKESDWFYEQVTEMVGLGFFNGKGDNLFCPDDTMTKAEFITVAAKMIYDKAELNLIPGDASLWWDKYYNACLGAGVILQEEFTRASMSEGIQRQEMAAIAHDLIMHLQGFYDFGSDAFDYVEKIPDIDMVKEEFADYVLYCYSEGILNGVDDEGHFNPEGTLTRAEASTVIYRILKRTEKYVYLNDIAESIEDK